MSNHRVDLGPEWAQMGEGDQPAKSKPFHSPHFELLDRFVNAHPQGSWGQFTDWLIEEYLKLQAENEKLIAKDEQWWDAWIRFRHAEKQSVGSMLHPDYSPAFKALDALALLEEKDDTTNLRLDGLTWE